MIASCNEEEEEEEEEEEDFLFNSYIVDDCNLTCKVNRKTNFLTCSR